MLRLEPTTGQDENSGWRAFQLVHSYVPEEERSKKQRAAGELAERSEALMPVAGDRKMQRRAILSRNGKFRYQLWRCWNKELPAVAFVMLNPSTADHRVDDPTIRRCIGFAKSWRFGSLAVVNLFAYRTPSVAALKAAGYPIGRRNDENIAAVIAQVSHVVLAYGIHAPTARIRAIVPLLRDVASTSCLGVTKNGSPRHPLYLPASTQRQELVLDAGPTFHWR